MEPFSFTCPCCGKQVLGLPDMAYAEPAYSRSVPEAERAKRVNLTSDLCTVDDKHFFIRAVCPVPVVGAAQDFGWGIWVSLSEENFQRYVDSFDDPEQSKLGGMFGWFSNQLPHYPNTLSLQTSVFPQDGNQRPLVYINDVHAEHPLYVDQQSGMPQEKLAQIYAENLCGKGSAEN